MYAAIGIINIDSSNDSEILSAFSVVDARIWNDLSADVTSAESLRAFHQ